MADKEETHLDLVTVVVLVAALAAAYQTYFGGKTGSPSPPPAAAAPAGPQPQVVPPAGEWVRPVDAPVWSGWRTVQRPSHNGVDLGASRGTPIRAASAGLVVQVRCASSSGTCDRDGSPQTVGCGWYVDIRHAGDIFTRYCHMLRRPDVAVYQTVKTGQVIGVVGSSGHSSDPHLHFEVHRGDTSYHTAVDPVRFMARRGALLATG